MSFLTPASVMAFLTVLSAIAGYFGKTQIVTLLGDPDIADAVSLLVTSVSGVITGKLWKKDVA